MYAPIANIIKSCKVDNIKELLRNPQSDFMSEKSKLSGKSNEVSLLENKAGYLIEYCGCIGIGTEGDVKQIEKAIRMLLQKGNINFIPVRFECLELGVKVTKDSNDEVSIEIVFLGMHVFI